MTLESGSNPPGAPGRREVQNPTGLLVRPTASLVHPLAVLGMTINASSSAGSTGNRTSERDGGKIR